jgi:hypothetical protein
VEAKVKVLMVKAPLLIINHKVPPAPVGVFLGLVFHHEDGNDMFL